jgi:hypothetical protein
MTETTATPAPLAGKPATTNGQAPVEAGGQPEPGSAQPSAAEEAQLTLPPGTIQLPPPMVARLTRLLREQIQVHDALYSYLEGRGETGPYALVLPVVLLVKQPAQGG